MVYKAKQMQENKARFGCLLLPSALKWSKPYSYNPDHKQEISVTIQYNNTKHTVTNTFIILFIYLQADSRKANTIWYKIIEI